MLLIYLLTATIVLFFRVNLAQIPENVAELKPQSYNRTLVLGGGQYNDTKFFEAVVKLAGGAGNAKIGIITAAADDPFEQCKFLTNIFLGTYKIRSVYCIPIHSNNLAGNSDPAVIREIRQQSGFVFGGGEPERIVSAFYLPNRAASSALLAIREMYDNGIVVAGASAGEECMTTNVMVWGGTGDSYSTLKYGPYEKGFSRNRDYFIYDKEGGLGMLEGFVLDAHFSQRGRQGRLMRLLSDTYFLPNGVEWGIGIDEDTGMIIRHVGTEEAVAEIIGDNGVTFIDISKSFADLKHQYYAVENILMHYLTNGDKMFLYNKTIQFSSTKTLMEGHERFQHPINSRDIFNADEPRTRRKPEFVKVTTSVFDAVDHHSAYGDTKEKAPTFRFVFSRAIDGSAGYSKRGRTFDEDVTSYTNLHVHVTGFRQ